MKILVICQYYYPEPFRISDICEELVKRGHEVTVITGVPNYPEGTIYSEYRHGQKREEIINGVKVHRCFTIERRTGIVWRFLNYYSYAISSTMYASILKEEFDVVFVNQLSPVMMASAGIRYKKVHNKKLVLYCLDLWPESLLAGRISHNSIVYKIFHRVSKWIYRQADEILLTSQMFCRYFESEFGISGDTLKYLPQYAESIFDSVSLRNTEKQINLVFAGNIGKTQNVSTIVYAADKLRDIPHLSFHILGDGSELAHCKKLADDLSLPSIVFYGRKPIQEMPAYYSMADAMLITMSAEPTLSWTLPGKMQSYMAAGKPIIGAINGEASRVILSARCGYCGPAEDSDALAKNIRLFLSDTKKSDLGRCSRAYYDRHFSVESFFEQLEETLEGEGFEGTAD